MGWPSAASSSSAEEFDWEQDPQDDRDYSADDGEEEKERTHRPDVCADNRIIFY